MREITRKYYIQESELGILLALKGVQTLYGICMDSVADMTQEELYHHLFVMQKKKMLNALQIEEGLDYCVEQIRTAVRFIVLADTDELVPEKYFYVAHEGAVLLEPAGQHGVFHLEAVTEEAVRNIICESGFRETPEDIEIPGNILREAQDCWLEDKDTILQHFAVKKLMQEYDVHTQCKKRQYIQFVSGLDTCFVCSDGTEGGEKSWY